MKGFIFHSQPRLSLFSKFQYLSGFITIENNQLIIKLNALLLTIKRTCFETCLNYVLKHC